MIENKRGAIIKQCKLMAMIAAMAGMALLQGCALLVVGGALAGAAYGTVKYANNTLQVTYDVALDKAWGAGNAALKDLQIPVTESKKDATYGKLGARNAHNQPVAIQIVRKTDQVTEIQITVGTFDSEANRSQEQLIYDKMKARF